MENVKKNLVSLVKELLEKGCFEAHVECVDNPLSDKEFIIIGIEPRISGHLLIGKGGQNLQALEHLVRLIVARRFGNNGEVRFVLDIDGYRKTRTDYVVN